MLQKFELLRFSSFRSLFLSPAVGWLQKVHIGHPPSVLAMMLVLGLPARLEAAAVV